MDLSNVDLFEAIKTHANQPKVEETPVVQEEEQPEVKEDEPVNETEEVEEQEETEQEESIVSYVLKNAGIETEEEFEDSHEGLMKVVDHVADNKAVEMLNGYLDQFPHLREFRDFLAMGGSPENFLQTKFPELDYEKVDIEEESVQKSVLSTWLRSQDFTEEEIAAKLEKYDAVDMLKEEAESALKKLQKKQGIEKESLMKKQEQEVLAQKESIEKYWSDVEKTVNGLDKINLLGIPVSPNERKELFNYMAKNVRNGMSQHMIDEQELTTEQRATLAYVTKQIKAGKDFSNVIKNEAKTLKVQEKKLAFTNEKINRSGKRPNAPADADNLLNKIRSIK